MRPDTPWGRAGASVARLWARATAPHPRITAAEDRHGARLLATLMFVHLASVLGLFLLVRAVVLHTLQHDIVHDRDSFVILLCTGLVLPPYVLLRLGWYRSAAALYVLLTAVMPLTAPFVADPRAEIGNLSLIVVPPLVAAFFFSPREVVAVLVAVVSLAAYRLVDSPMPPERAGTGFAIVMVLTVVGALILVFQRRNTTLERLRLQRLRESEEALQRTSERLRLLLANSLDVILGIDRDGTILFTGGAVRETLGREAADLLGYPLTQFVAPEDLAAVEALCRDVRETPGLRRRAEWRQLHADGTHRWIESLVSNHLDLPGVAGIVLNLRDITDRRLAQEEHGRLEARMQDLARLELTGRMAGAVAHDFNNMLTVIMGNLELARAERADPERLARRLGAMDGAVGQATALTGQLLTFARRGVTRTERIRPAAVLAALEGAVRQVCGPAVTVTLEPGEPAATIRFDLEMLEQIVMNLAMNARDAMPEGGTFRLALDRGDADGTDGDGLRLRATDSGTGMTEEVRRHLFEPFFTTKARRVGTGLGLATIRSAMDQAGGTIAVSSAPGLGTEFTLVWPHAVDAADDAAGAPARDAAGGPPGGSETILYAEDNPGIRQMTRETLAFLGYRVLEAPDGREALAAARGAPAPIHLLLTDMLMPGLNGRQLADALAAVHPETKVLYTSGYTEDVLTDAERGSGRLPFLPKPYTTAVLAARIREVLDGG